MWIMISQNINTNYTVSGDIDKAQEIVLRTDALTQEKADVLVSDNKLRLFKIFCLHTSYHLNPQSRIAEQRRNLLQRTGVDVNKKLRVCDVCGSFLSILDSDQ